MELLPRGRRRCRELPPDLSGLMNDLFRCSRSFTGGFRSSEERLGEIVMEIRRITEDVKMMQDRTDTIRSKGAFTAGVGAGVGLCAAGVLLTVGTGGLGALLLPALAAGAAGAAGAAAGGGAVVRANISKKVLERHGGKEVEELGEEFIRTVDPLKKILEEVQKTCERLEQKSSEVLAEKTLEGLGEFQKTLEKVSELRGRTGGALDVAVIVMQSIGDLLKRIVGVFRVTATPEEDQNLTNAILESADQSQEVLDAFQGMKQHLEELLEM